MTSACAVNDNHAPNDDFVNTSDSQDNVSSDENQPTIQSIVSTAILLRTAFRLRDEDAMISLLRNLANCVDCLEQEQDAA